MLDPITFPNAIFELSLNKAWTVTKSSGHDVEKRHNSHSTYQCRYFKS